MSTVRPILEYACPAWHTSLTKEQSCQIEHIQKRTMKIIFDSNYANHENLCLVHKLDTLEARRTEMCKSSHRVVNNNCENYFHTAWHVKKHRRYLRQYSKTIADTVWTVAIPILRYQQPCIDVYRTINRSLGRHRSINHVVVFRDPTRTSNRATFIISIAQLHGWVHLESCGSPEVAKPS